MSDHDLERLERLGRILLEWVERERAELDRSGERPSQLYLRRTRISEYVAEPEFREALRELMTVGGEISE